MADIERQIEELTRQLAALRSQPLQMNNEMVLLETQLESLRAVVLPNIGQTTENENAPVSAPSASKTEMPYIHQLQQNLHNKTLQQPKRSFRINREMEDFIGTNVISKIGILVTIIGVFIGAKYAIDNELISPFMRILAGLWRFSSFSICCFQIEKEICIFQFCFGGRRISSRLFYNLYSL